MKIDQVNINITRGSGIGIKKITKQRHQGVLLSELVIKEKSKEIILITGRN